MIHTSDSPSQKEAPGEGYETTSTSVLSQFSHVPETVPGGGGGVGLYTCSRAQDSLGSLNFLLLFSEVGCVENTGMCLT